MGFRVKKVGFIGYIGIEGLGFWGFGFRGVVGYRGRGFRIFGFSGSGFRGFWEACVRLWE